MKHRIVILVSFGLLIIAGLGFKNRDIFPAPILALLGILVVISSLASPVMVFYSIRELLTLGINKTTISYVCLSIVYFVFVILGVYKIWPQLMGV
jgi:hypothetical protein